MTDTGFVKGMKGGARARIAVGLARYGAPGEVAAFLLMKGQVSGAHPGSREEEAALALQSLALGLAAAMTLFALSVGFESMALRFTALVLFAANLVRLLPVRRLAGGRLFPGFDWPDRGEGAPGLRLRLSLAAERQLRRFALKAGLDAADRPRPLAHLLGPALVAVVVGGFLSVCVAALCLPMTAWPAAILVWVAATLGAVAVVLLVDRRVLNRHVREGLAPRRTIAMPRVMALRPVFVSRSGAKAALSGYLTLLAADALGAGAALTGLAA